MLNQEQQAVIHASERFIFCLAGAGSGKTRVIVEKIKLLMKQGVSPQCILAITFTRKSAQEMKHRIKIDDVHVHTFHQMCLMHLEKTTTTPFVFLTSLDHPFSSEDLLKISIYKNSLYRLKKPLNYEKYLAYLISKGCIDFDDLLIMFLKSIRKNPMTFDYIFIDEFQDTNLLQFDILRALITSKTKCFAVGDPDQSIYKFRGAHSKIIDLYVKTFHATIYKLTLNYRCAKNILKHANHLILKQQSNYKKMLVPFLEEDGDVSFQSFDSETQEAIFLMEAIKRHMDQRIKAHEIAILYRTHQRAFTLMNALDQADISYTKDEVIVGHINLMSLHQSKGLEFEVVYIIGLEDHVMPKLYDYQISQLKEERRLLFVGMTRAKHQLSLSNVLYSDENTYLKPSLFLKETKGISSKKK